MQIRHGVSIPRFRARSHQHAFTLIELLIVVTVIAILAAIAIPNFLEAQTRAKVSRTKADMRSLATAVESYRVENNHYPFRRHLRGTSVNDAPSTAPTAQVTFRAHFIKQITTPVAYISSLPRDVFERRITAPNNLIDYYDLEQTSWLLNATHPRTTQPQRRVPLGGAGWMLISVGPDNILGAVDNSCACPLGTVYDRGTIYFVYDPTNGSVSTGNIYYSSHYGMENGKALTRQFYGGD
jgi:type II secretion system protein G